MASYNELIALIDAFIKRNGVQAITGQILNGVLKAMVDQVGRGYAIMGVATPSTNPGTPDAPESWFASTPGTYTNFGGLEVADAEFALLSYTPSGEVWTKTTLTEGIQEVSASIDGNVGTPEVTAEYINGGLIFTFSNMKGQTGDAAGFGTVNATVDGNIGTPGVSVNTSGPDTAKNITFAFRNLKGETGVTSVVATVDNTTGSPSCSVSLVGQELHLDFHGLKGAQGDTGSSVDYPFTIVNNLTTDDPTQALSAAQGVVLAGELSQLEAKIVEKSYVNIFNPDDVVTGYLSSTAGEIISYAPYVTTNYIPVIPGQVFHKAKDSEKGFRFSLMYSAIGVSIPESYVSSDADTITVPSGAAYMRVTMYANNNKNQISLFDVNYYAYNPISKYVYDILGDFQSADITSILSRLSAIELFDETIPVSDIRHITKNVFCLKDYYIDNSYYGLTIGNLVTNVSTYGCTQKMPVDCSYLFNSGFKPSTILFWDSEDNYLGSATPVIGGKTDFPDNTAFVAYNMIKASQPAGYIDSGILYNLEPFIPYANLNARISSLESFKNEVPLDETKQLTKRLFCVKNIFIDNKYYNNSTGSIVSNVSTYACTEKIPVDKAYYYTDGFKQSTCLCWDDSSFLGTCQYNNQEEKRFNLLEGTTFIAFNFQKSVQPDDYVNNGIIYNLQPFVEDYEAKILEINSRNILYGKKWCVCGDSFSAWTTEQDGTTYKTYHYFIGKRNNMSIVNMSVSGRTMAYPSDHTFDNALAKPSVYQSIPADSDYITIMLGINDASHLAGYSPDGESTAGAISLGAIDSTDTGTFYGAWNVVLQWLFENRPLAHIGIILTNGLGNQGPFGGYSQYGMQIFTALKDIVKKWNVPFIDLNGGDGKTPMMQRGIYPEGTAPELIAAKWDAFATSPTTPYNGHTNVDGHLYESTFIENFLRTL